MWTIGSFHRPPTWNRHASRLFSSTFTDNLKTALDKAGLSEHRPALMFCHNRLGLHYYESEGRAQTAAAHLEAAHTHAAAMAAEGYGHDAYQDVGGLLNDRAVVALGGGGGGDGSSSLKAVKAMLGRAKFSAERAYRPSPFLLAATYANLALASSVEAAAASSTEELQVEEGTYEAGRDAATLARKALAHEATAMAVAESVAVSSSPSDDRKQQSCEETGGGAGRDCRRRLLRCGVLLAAARGLGTASAVSSLPGGFEEAMISVAKAWAEAREGQSLASTAAAASDHGDHDDRPSSQGTLCAYQVAEARALATAAWLHLECWQKVALTTATVSAVPPRRFVSCAHLVGGVDGGLSARGALSAHTFSVVTPTREKKKHAGVECSARSGDDAHRGVSLACLLRRALSLLPPCPVGEGEEPRTAASSSSSSSSGSRVNNQKQPTHHNQCTQQQQQQQPELRMWLNMALILCEQQHDPQAAATALTTLLQKESNSSAAPLLRPNLTSDLLNKDGSSSQQTSGTDSEVKVELSPMVGAEEENNETPCASIRALTTHNAAVLRSLAAGLVQGNADDEQSVSTPPSALGVAEHGGSLFPGLRFELPVFGAFGVALLDHDDPAVLNITS